MMKGEKMSHLFSWSLILPKAYFLNRSILCLTWQIFIHNDIFLFFRCVIMYVGHFLCHVGLRFIKKNIILSNPIPTKIIITKLFVKSFIFIHDQVSFIYIYIIHIKKAHGADIPKSLKPILVF